MTEPVDWNKPIELMDGKPRVAESCGNYIWINSPDGYGGFHCDRQGCIGGVQVVRNRKEPVKHLYYVRWSDGDMGAAIYSSRQAPISGREQLAKILIWLDESGKTRVEVCDE